VPPQATAHPPGKSGPYRVAGRLRWLLFARAPRCEFPGCGARADGVLWTAPRRPPSPELVLDGELHIRMADGDVVLTPGQVFVVPKGVEHQPVSEQGASVLLLEPSGTVNTGDTPSDLTAERRVVGA
jgi:hypothetical protein